MQPLQFVTNLGSSFGTVGANGSVTISEAFANEVFSTTTSSEYATASQLTELQTQVSNIPVTIRQDDEPAIYDAQNELINPLGSIWVDTNDSNALYILTEDLSQTPSVFWQATSSEALGDLIQSTAELQETVNTLSTDQSALASKTTTLTAQFGVYDPATDTFTIDSNSDYFEEVKTYADTGSATAQKVDSIGTTFGSYDAETNSFTVSNASMETIVDALSLPSYASTSRVDTIETEVGNIPLIFKQNDAPAVDNPLGSLWFDTDDDNKRYILTSGTPNTWNVLEDGEFQTFKSSATEDINTNASDISAEASRVTNLNAVLEILDANGDLQVATKADYFEEISTYVDDNSATASKVETLEATVGDASSGLVASVETNQSAIADVEGNLDAQYGLQVTAGGAVAGMKLSASASDTGVSSSAIAFNADVFKIFTGSEQNPGSQAPFLLDSNGLQLNVPLNGVSGSFSGDISAASGTFGGVTLDSNGITSNEFSIDSDGNATFSGDISAATGTFTGGLNINNRFLVSTSGSTTIKAGDTSSRFEIQNDTGGSKYRLFGHKINFNSWAGGTNFDDASNQFSPGFLQFGGVAYMYSGNGTTTTGNHHMTLDVYGGSKKLFLKADEITLRKSTTTGGSHTTIIEGDLEVQGSVSFSSGASTTDTTYDIKSVTTTGGAFLRLTGSDSTTDDVKFSSSGATTVSYISDNTIQIHSTDTNTQRSDEEIRDLVAGFVQEGSNVTVSHDDSANTLTISATDTNTQRTDEEIRDVIAPFVVGGTYISVSHDDGANTLTVSHSDTSSQASVNNSNGTVIQDVTLDSRGHVTGLGSTNLDNRFLRKDVDVAMDSGHTITATDFILASDQRLKSDINTYTPQHININYRDYVVNNGGDRRRVGVIAQELERNHPEFVMTNPDSGLKSVSYIDMLVAKVAELEERIKQLENGST